MTLRRCISPNFRSRMLAPITRPASWKHSALGSIIRAGVLTLSVALLIPIASHAAGMEPSGRGPGAVAGPLSRQSQASISGVSVSWGSSGSATLLTNADGLRLLPAGRNTDMPWLGISRISITLSASATLSPSDVSVTGVNVANYGPVTIAGSGTSYTITLAQPISSADRVVITIGNAAISTYTRRLDVLPGDVGDDGSVTVADAVLVRNMYLGLSAVSVFGDVNGDGVVDAADYNLVRQRIGTQLP